MQDEYAAALKELDKIIEKSGKMGATLSLSKRLVQSQKINPPSLFEGSLKDY